VSVRVAALFIHPLKSAAPVSVATMHLDDMGAIDDRRWLLVDARGRAITQRDVPRLALVHALVEGIGTTRELVLRAPELAELRVAASAHGPPRRVDVWGDEVEAHDLGDAAAEWCRAATGRACRLVRMADHAQRPLAAKYAGAVDPAGRRVAFTDGAPLLLLGQASVDALSARLAGQGSATLGVERFRPNVLISGIEAHEEDDWAMIAIGDVRCGVGSSCSRCVVTTVDQVSGRRAGPEPLRTLAGYRARGNDVMFGVNATNEAGGTIHVGDRIEVIRRK
jgi:uncharacterized protein